MKARLVKFGEIEVEGKRYTHDVVIEGGKVGFTFLGWGGWVGIVLIALKFFHVISWPWWVAALPLEYGVLYCLYMTIDGALYRSGRKDIGGYARLTATDEQLARFEFEQALRNPERKRGKEG